MPTPFDSKLAGDEHAGTLLSQPEPAPPLSRYHCGAVLSGKYRLESLLGEGGMGAVWQATNLLLELPVAIKLIRADLDRGALRARLQLEARSAAKLGHPAIVRVYDVGESELGDPFIVMELLQGETLAKLLSNGRMSGARAVQLLLPIIDALAMAHARGIVHRDLKPDNVMITVEDQQVQPKILDFGIAKLTDPRDSDHKLTEVGTVVGSPDYMSPEQARGRDDVDASTDIWSVCVVLYEAITGSAPFNAANYNALLRAIVEDAPKSIVEHAAGDARLWEIVQRGLAKDRLDRYATMNDLGRALATWLVGHGVEQDVCGTSLQAKWLDHHGAPAELTDSARPPRVKSGDFQSKATRDSAATGLSRGSFTATIRPHAVGRKRAFGAAVVGVALLGISALVLSRARSTLQPTPSSSQAAALTLPTPPARTAVQDPPPVVNVEAAPTRVPAPPVASASTETPMPKPSKSAQHVTKPIAPSPHVARASAPVSASKPVPTAAPTPAPAAVKPSERPLDLLAPY